MNFVRFLKKYGDVDLLYLDTKSKSQDVPSPFRKEYCIPTTEEAVNVHGKKRDSRSSRFRRKLIRMAERRPSMLTEWAPSAVNEMASLLMAEKYDIILCRYIHNSFPFFRFPVEIRKRIVIDIDDFYSDVNLNIEVRRRGNPYKIFKDFIERHLIINYQKRCLNFGATLVCSENDYGIISYKKKINNVFIIPNTCPNDEIYCNNNAGYENRDVFLFVGTLNYGPNSKGLEWFIESLFPYIKKRNSSSRLLVVGRDPEENLIAKCGKVPGIELHANVPDLSPFYERCGIVVVPILSGAGTRIKILEAGMAGRPVFSTPLGAYGLDVTDGKDIMIFSDLGGFIERYERMNKRETYENMKNNLKYTVEMKYSMESFNKGMKEVMSFITSNHI